MRDGARDTSNLTWQEKALRLKYLVILFFVYFFLNLHNDQFCMRIQEHEPHPVAQTTQSTVSFAPVNNLTDIFKYRLSVHDRKGMVSLS